MNTFEVMRFDRALHEEEAARLSRDAENAGLHIMLSRFPQYGRSYALLEIPQDRTADEVLTACPGAKRLSSIVALAIELSEPQALPSVLSALAPSGAPVGVSAEIAGDSLLLEIDVSKTSWRVVQALLASELTRLHTGIKKTTQLAPMSIETEARIAADGLQCTEIAPDRVLEVLIEGGPAILRTRDDKSAAPGDKAT